MAMKTGQLDLQQFALLGVVLHSTPSPPTSPVAGQWWHNSDTEAVSYYKDGEWVRVATQHDLDDILTLAAMQSGSAVAAHSADTTNVHGIPNTADLVTQADLDSLNLGGFFLEQNFASASTHWVINHGQGDYGINIETYTPDGVLIEGEVARPDPNTITVDFYYPTTGYARVFD